MDNVHIYMGSVFLVIYMCNCVVLTAKNEAVKPTACKCLIAINCLIYLECA